MINIKYFGIALLLVSTTLAASLPGTFDQPKLYKNDNRIVGGNEASITKHPHQVSLTYKKYASSPYSHSCGGSILKANIIITAGHCVFNRVPENCLIVAGTSFRNGGDGYMARASEIIIHEHYNSSNFDNDVALIILSTPFHLNGVTVSSITLTSEAPKHGSKAVITGWGTTSSGGFLSNELLEVEVPIVSNEFCNDSYAAYFGVGRITKSMICATVAGYGGKDACQGDSGGPLLVNHKLAGIVSWGLGCASADFPGVYSNVAYLRDWIDSKAAQYA